MSAPARWVRLACLAALALPAAAAVAAEDDEPALDEILVTATRTPGLVRDEPLHVEVLPREEIEENLTVQPGNLTSLLHELPGVRMQSSGPGLGGVGLQLRGMPARDTLVLADGLPLFGAVPDAYGLLQAPPLDLDRVEVIKGAAAALYGGAALGGVLNLVSRRADSEPAVLVNGSSLGGRDLVAFFTLGRGAPWSGTLTAGAHAQSRHDVDGDGWADIAGYRRYTLRPRAWWDGGGGRSLFLTAGFVSEDRRGGTLGGRSLPDGDAYAEELRTRRFDAGAVSQWRLAAGATLSGRYAFASTRMDRTSGAERVASTQTTVMMEEALDGSRGKHRWVLGVAFAHDGLAVPTAPGLGYVHDVPGAFAQDTYRLAPGLVIAGSVRADAAGHFGTFVSPRLSALLRAPQGAWSLRASLAGGYALPTPLVEAVESTGLGSLAPLAGVRAERAMTASVDGRWADDGWDVNLSLFTSQIRHTLEVVPEANQLRLVNARGTQRAPGAEVLIGYVSGPLHALASFSSMHATRIGTTGERADVPLLPRASGSLDALLESARHGRIGLELDYTGPQALEDNPFRSTSHAYFTLNALAELRIGGMAIFLNGIDLTDVRQTHYDPLLRPRPGPGGTPITAAWAPLDGRTFNLGVRAEL